MKLAIVGSTAFKNEGAEAVAKTLIAHYVMALEPDVLVSGGAVGVDSWAAEFADSQGIPKAIFLPHYRRWAPEGFAERNLLIAEECTHLLRIYCMHSSTYGSGWTADRAVEQGKPVWRIEL